MSAHCHILNSPGLLTVLAALICLVLCDVTAIDQPASTASPEGSGGVGGQCNEGLPPPDQPFKVVWNHPDRCEPHVHLHLDQYGFTFNKGRVFSGEEIRTLYHTGRWPTLSSTGEAINGGLPQLFNYTNLSQTWKDLGGPSDSFNGLAVMDFEVWRAIYITNFGSMEQYKRKSVELIRRLHPEYSQNMLVKTAEREWEEAARKLMLTKLTIGQTLKPGGHWGYYNYPRTWGGNSSPYQNNKIEWLWRQTTGLYPSIYVVNTNRSTSSIATRVTKIMGEAVRIQHSFSSPNTAIYPYSNLQQGNVFYGQDYLQVTLGLTADMGASGVVLWGSSSLYRRPGQCHQVQEHIRTVLGPYVRNLTHFMSDCSTALCGGHGRCVHNSRDSLLNETESKALSALCAPPDSRFHDYHCRCYSRWSGACCQTATSSPSPCQPGQGHGGDILHNLDETLIG